jgi:hypothetical protein
MSKLAALVAQFVEAVSSRHTDVYNEFSLQHEFGIFLRQKLPTFQVQFERHVNFFFPSKASFTKKEIDISIFSPDKKELRYAIELKYPRNGQYPEQMFSFCEDVAFAEELKHAGFSSTALMIFAHDPLFYRGRSEGIYGLFRGARPIPIHGLIQKPTGSKNAEVNITGNYAVQWKPMCGLLMYTLIEIGGSD